jgi:hypothetical protein
MTLAGWTLFFFSESQPFPDLVLYVPTIIGLMYLWSWLLPTPANAQVVSGQTPLPNAEANPVARLVAGPARRLMWLGILGLIGTLLIQCRGYGETMMAFGLPAGPIFWRVSVPAGWGPIALAADRLLPALYLLVAIGTWNMLRFRNRPLALAGATLAMVLPPLFPVSLPLGSWASFVLATPEIKLEFSRAERSRLMALQRATPRLSRVALASALVGILPGLLNVAAIAMTRDFTVMANPPMSRWQLVLA